MSIGLHRLGSRIQCFSPSNELSQKGGPYTRSTRPGILGLLRPFSAWCPEVGFSRFEILTISAVPYRLNNFRVLLTLP